VQQKKNKPDLKIGSLIYARVILANKDIEPEISCLSARNKAEGYGELNEGYMFKSSINLCYTLLDDDCLILKLIGKYVPYEIAVGMNGRIWVHSKSYKHTILISNAILNSEFMTPNQIHSMISKISTQFN
jgi:exosome complex component RRP40